MPAHHDEEIAVTVERLGQTVVVRPEGEIDLSRSPGFRNHLVSLQSSAPVGRLVVDLQGVPYMDSSGLATLVEAMQMALRRNTTLVLCGLQDRVRSIIEIAKLDKVFTIVPDVEQAMQM